ncbi:MAG: VCBS repeat-containing protein, partial [Verrucomicrobiota bacterium]
MVVHLFGDDSAKSEPKPATSSSASLPAETIHSIPLNSSPVSESSSLFERLPAAQTGIDLIHEFPKNVPFELLQEQGSGAGVCVGDYDEDGNADIFLTNYDRGNRLYRNRGGWRFEDVTAKAGVGGAGRWCSGATFVDIDNDGDLDLSVCVFNAPNLLFLNQGDGTFKEQAKAFGLDFAGANVMMAFADYDRDGRLDAYLVTHRLNVGTDHHLPRNSKEAFTRSVLRASGGAQPQVNPAYRELFELINKGTGRAELIIAGQQDYLYHNDGNGRFNVVNARAGIHGNEIGLAATWWDYNGDGLPDLYVSNDYKGPDHLYRNNGDGSFTDVVRSASPHIPWASMGADVADINNDGLMDFIATDMSGSRHFRRMMINGDIEKERWFLISADPRQYRRNAVFLSTGNEHLMEVAHLTGLESTDWTWSPKFGDLDNDGWIDLFIANGMSRDFVNRDLLKQMKERDNPGWFNTPVLREANLAFRNLGDLRFKNVSKEWGLAQVSASYGAALADLDRDGDLDLIVTNFGEPVSVYRNTGASGNRVLFRLKGTRSNSWGIGATVKIETPSGMQACYLTVSSGFISANEPLVHFGLGERKKIDRLTVEWPSGHRQTFDNLDVNRFYTITEPDNAAPGRTKLAQPPTWFQRGKELEGVRHRENDYDDYQREPLLPWKLSQLGPGLAVGDVNGDGLDDLYLGGAAGQIGLLCLHEASGRFRPVPQPCFEEDKANEDMGALFFDADADGDLDLYVVSGGVECESGDPVLRDRLYLNDGNGNFTKAPVGALPDLRDSGSVVAAADFDRDGDLDLFVGGRVVPGKYPLTPNSRLLRNDHGRFIEVTDEIAHGLKQSGLVTSAVWSDVNGDGWLDLLMTHEWGPVKLYLNNQGRLEDHTREAGLADKLGWWNGIAAGDLDGDGDIDYIVGNFGLNTRYRAAPQRPVLAFYGEFDNTGRKQLIEAYYEGETLYPLRVRSDSVAVFPLLAEKFPTFQSFAAAALQDIYSPTSLAMAQRFEVNSLESAVLLNDGKGHFTFRALPRLAQAAPAFGVAIADVDGDGKPDLYLAQNFFSPQPETGRMDGGLSLLLRGNGDGSFTPVWPKESGLVVPGDAKGLVVID